MKGLSHHHLCKTTVDSTKILLLPQLRLTLIIPFIILISNPTVLPQPVCLPACPSVKLKELLRNKRRLTWGWAKVLFMASVVKILNRWTWPGLFYLSPLCVSLVMANEWEGAFFWPMAFSHLCCDIQTRMRLHREARPQGQPQVTGPQGKYTYKKMTKNSATGSVFACLQNADLATKRMLHPCTGGIET
jgi:hypothetical protein